MENENKDLPISAHISPCLPSAPNTPPFAAQKDEHSLVSCVEPVSKDDTNTHCEENANLNVRRETLGAESCSASTTSEKVIERSQLHCRLCKSDPCVDVTATFCGHIFCYG